MDTIAEKINSDLESLGKQLIDFIHANTRLRRVFHPGDGVISTSGDFSFEDLKTEALPAQDKLYKSFNKTFELVGFLLFESPKVHTKEFKKNSEIIIKFVLQNSLTWCKTIIEVTTKIKESIKKIQDILSSLFVKCNLPPLIVPDTNAWLPPIRAKSILYTQLGPNIL